MTWNDRSDWVWSTEQTHEPLVSAELFAAAAEQRRSEGTARPSSSRGTSTPTVSRRWCTVASAAGGCPAPGP